MKSKKCWQQYKINGIENGHWRRLALKKSAYGERKPAIIEAFEISAAAAMAEIEMALIA